MDKKGLSFYIGELIGFVYGFVTEIIYRSYYGYYFGLGKSRGLTEDEADEFAHRIASEKIGNR